MLNEQGKVLFEDMIKLARKTPGFGTKDGSSKDQPGRGERLNTMLATARTKIDFAVRKKMLFDSIGTVLARQNTDPERISFFIGLATLLAAPGSKSDLDKIETEVLTPLSDSILKSDRSEIANIERSVIEQVRATITTISNNKAQIFLPCMQQMIF